MTKTRRKKTQPQEEVPDVVPEEVKHAIKHMKTGKKPGEDGITIDIVKEGGEELTKILSGTFTDCIKQNKLPNNWR
ncbi:UNVERIFIED_CONTAM: hypothetical protein FKN15_078439 [Acipenser sinensis]